MGTSARARGWGRSLAHADPLGRPTWRCAGKRNPRSWPCGACGRRDALTPEDVRRGRLCSTCRAYGEHDLVRSLVTGFARHEAAATGEPVALTFDSEGGWSVDGEAAILGVAVIDAALVLPDGAVVPVRADGAPDRGGISRRRCGGLA